MEILLETAKYRGSGGKEPIDGYPFQAVRRGLHNLLIMKIAVARWSIRLLCHHTAVDSLTGGLAKGETAVQGS